MGPIDMNRISAKGRIDPARIDPDAIKVIRRLRQNGYEAYLVGGSVRDLWLGRSPKDFDMATSASPRQIKRVFSNSRLIGRRFRLAHVVYGPKIFEVSTFRSNIIASEPDDTVGDEGEERDLLIRDDNVFGTAEQDGVRRDFTINGLFYDPDSHEVIDYVEGIADLDAKLIRCIGDPEIRLREDPVRILRAIKFAARLGFTIHDDTYGAMLSHRGEILRCSPARVYEEIMRLLASGASQASLRLMWDSGVLDVLLPDLTEHLRKSELGHNDPLWDYLGAIDSVDRAKRQLSAGILIGAAFWPVFEDRMERPEFASLDYGLRVDRVVDSVTRNLRLPKRENALLKQVLVARRRLRPEGGLRHHPPTANRMAGKAYFGPTLAFCEIELRAEGAGDDEIAQWEADLLRPAAGGAPGAAQGPRAPADGKRKRRRRRRRPGGPQTPPAPAAT